MEGLFALIVFIIILGVLVGWARRSPLWAGLDPVIQWVIEGLILLVIIYFLLGLVGYGPGFGIRLGR